jgi:hypothetical protein
MAQAGKLFDKKNGGGGGGGAGNQAGKVEGPYIVLHLALTEVLLLMNHLFICSDAFCCSDSHASVRAIQDYGQGESGTRGDAEFDGRCDVVLIEVTVSQ